MSIPSYIYANVNGERLVIREEWYSAGQLHRMDGPAYQQWTIASGRPVLIYADWMLKGKPHRVDGPAVQVWTVGDGQPVLTYEAWCLEGQRHRVDGPARKQWRIMNGSVVLISEEWWLQGKKVDPLASPYVQALTTTHLRACGLMIWPGLMGLILGYAV